MNDVHLTVGTQVELPTPRGRGRFVVNTVSPNGVEFTSSKYEPISYTWAEIQLILPNIRQYPEGSPDPEPRVEISFPDA